VNAQPAITAAQVTDILEKRKFVSAVKQDNTKPSKSELKHKSYRQPNEKSIYWDLRFVDMRDKPIPLQFHARIETPLSGLRSIRPLPGASLLWKGVRIRGVNWSIRHDNLHDGVQIAPVRKWHEKLYTEIDRDKYIIDINNDVKSTDFWAIVKFCCNRWNIEFPEEPQMKMGDKP